MQTDDVLKASPQLAPWRPAVGITPKLTDAELVTLAMTQALLGFTFEAKWLSHARTHLRHLFPYLPQQPGYNKRLLDLLDAEPELLATRPGAELFKPVRQVIESANETFKGRLDLERHHGRTLVGGVARVMQRILTLTTAIWHNDRSGRPVLRSLTAYDH
ncbi:hypothetical protein ABTZ59_33845 [Streptomyces sp. NPDC094034]|uniref:hypothetical protein n=1 Tax=Streptomyces sp. NPDC094034 TaxID=3155309 RepID=UPI00331B3FD0